MPTETETASTPEPKVEPQPSMRERMTATVAEQWQGVQAASSAAATESATVETQSAEGSQEAPAGAATETAETTPPAQTAAQDDTPYTPEQLRDSSFWGKLDKDGWAKAERLHPVETKHIKAAQAAATKIVNDARKQTATPDPPPPQTPPVEEESPDPELQAVFDAIDLGDMKERAKAFRRLVQMAAESVPEVQAQREQNKVQTVMQKAHYIALNGDEENGLPPMPELDDLDEAALNAAYENDPEAKALTKVGTPLTIALAMRRVGHTVLAQKGAAESKYQEEQEKLRRNANTPASNAVTPRAGGPVVKQGETRAQFVARQWQEAQARTNR